MGIKAHWRVECDDARCKLGIWTEVDSALQAWAVAEAWDYRKAPDGSIRCPRHERP